MVRTSCCNRVGRSLMSEETFGRFLCDQIFDTTDDACNTKLLHLECGNCSYCDSRHHGTNNLRRFERSSWPWYRDSLFGGHVGVLRRQCLVIVLEVKGFLHFLIEWLAQLWLHTTFSHALATLWRSAISPHHSILPIVTASLKSGLILNILNPSPDMET